MSKTVTAILLSLLAAVANAAGNLDEPNSRKLSWWGNYDDYDKYIKPTPPPAPCVKKVDVTVTKKTIEVVKEKKTVEVDLMAYCEPLIKCMSTCMIEPYWQFFSDAKYECFKEYPEELQFCQTYMKEYFNEHGIEMPDFETYSKADWAPKGDVSRDKVIEATKTLEKTVTKTMVTKVKKVKSIVKPVIKSHGYDCVDIYDKYDSLKPYKEVKKVCETKETVFRELIEKKVIKSPYEVEYEPKSEEKCKKIWYDSVLDCEYMKKYYDFTCPTKPKPTPVHYYEKDDTPAITVKVTRETVTLFKQADTLHVPTAAFCKPLVECISKCYIEPYWHIFGYAQQDCFAKHTSELAVCQHYLPELLNYHEMSYPSYETYTKPDWKPSSRPSATKVVKVVQYMKQIVTNDEANSARRAINDIDNAHSTQVVLKFRKSSYYAIEDVRKMAEKAKRVVKEYALFKKNVIKCPTEVDECPRARKHCDEITRKAVVDKDTLKDEYGAKVWYSDGEMNISWD